MDKNIIRKFAIQARRDLIEQVQTEANILGIDENGALDELPSSTSDIKFYRDENSNGITGKKIRWRTELVSLLNNRSQKADWKTAFNDVVEEVAYTWFNRIIAIRFMEVNDYLPSRIRVLSSEEGRVEPDIIFYAKDAELIEEIGGYSQQDLELVDRASASGRGTDMDEMYHMLFNKQVDALNDILPGLFEKTSDYMKLLFTPKYNSGVIKNLINEIPEEYFDVEKEGQVEIIGWLYQYYNEEPKSEVIGLPKSTKYRDTQIARATQIFTPDWIVKYMVQNSLGKYWVKHLLISGDSRNEQEIADDFQWQYYMTDASQNKDVQKLVYETDQNLKNISVKDIKVIDPAMGSGHILVYSFDVLMQIYKSEGYVASESAQNIVENNLFGLDIDSRAYQLAYFAVMMKCRNYYRRAFKKIKRANLFYISSNNLIQDNETNILSFLLDKKHYEATYNMFALFKNGNELGSLLNCDNVDIVAVQEGLKILHETQPGQISFDIDALERIINNELNISKLLQNQYSIVITNPPYMGSSRMNQKLSSFAKKSYPNSKSDLFSMFIERWNEMMLPGGYNSIVTMQSWMFLSSFEKMRINQLNKYTISNLMHMENNVMGIAFGTAVTIFRNMHIEEFDGTYHQIKTKDAAGKIPEKLPIPGNRYNRSNQTKFNNIPGLPLAYWVTENITKIFKKYPQLSDYASPRKGNSTSNNARFLRKWYEVSILKINFASKFIDKKMTRKKNWFPYNKGGGFRKWYGNNEYLINWFDDGKEIRAIPTAVIANYNYFMHPGITWGTVTSSNISFRNFGDGFIFDNGGCSIFDLGIYNNYLLGLLNSNIFPKFIGSLNPTLNFQSGNISKMPIIYEKNLTIEKSVSQCIHLSKIDWDVFETSWDFKVHPLFDHIAEHKQNWTIEEAYNQWEQEALDRFNQLKANEEELNRIFIDLYGLQDELSPEEEDKDVSVRKADKERDIKSFLSYFIGCVFGRYSLDSAGLAYAGGQWDSGKYKSFVPNNDNVIVLTDDDYFGDQRDIMHRLKEFLIVTFGKDNLYKNLDFIASALDESKLKKGIESQQIIRDYFLNDFFKKDHLKIYQKRPIYWELNSGKSKGFKALIYQHRYDSDSMAMIRSGYLHDLQDAYENALKVREKQKENESDKKMIKSLDKDISNLNKKIAELVKFDQDLQHVASQQIEIDLDDGVVVNHKKVQSDVKILTPIK